MRKSKGSVGGSHTERVLGVNYNMAFRILGPTLRQPPKLEKKRGGPIKWPDEAVLEARRLYKTLPKYAVHAELTRHGRYPGLPESWVSAVLDEIIRVNVKEKTACT
jgi:hypothetical protein